MSAVRNTWSNLQRCLINCLLGTFTDLILLTESGETFRTKVLSTPEDQSIGVKNGIEELRRKMQIEGRDLKFEVLNHG